MRRGNPTGPLDGAPFIEAVRARIATGARSLTRWFRLDFWFGLALFSLGTVSILYLIPLVPPDPFNELITWYVDILLFAVLVGCAWSRAWRSMGRARRFFAWLGGSYLSWWLLKVLYLIEPLYVILDAIGSELFYFGFYLSFQMALFAAPGTGHQEHASPLIRSVRRTLPIAWIGILFLYHAILPATLDVSTYYSGYPSYVAFVVLDFYFASSFLVLMSRARGRRWQMVYFLIAASIVFWFLIDSTALLDQQPFYPVAGSAAFVYMPYLLFALACQLETPADEVPSRADRVPAGGLGGKTLFLFGLTLPFIHLTGYQLELFSETLRESRDLLVLIWLALFTALALLQGSIADRRGSLLETIRARNVWLLEAIGVVQSRFITSNDTRELFWEQISHAVSLSESTHGFIARLRAREPDRLTVAASLGVVSPNPVIQLCQLNERLCAALETGAGRIHAETTDAKGLFAGGHLEAPFAWLPLRHGEQTVGVIFLGGRTSGYDQELLVYLEPFLRTCAGIMSAHELEQERERIAERVRRTNQILDESLEEIYIFEANSLRFLQVNRGARENLGYGEAELAGMTPENLVSEEDLANFRRQIDHLRESEQNRVLCTTELVRKDGTAYPVDVFIQRSMMETVPVFVAFVVDVSERRAMEAEREALTAQVIQAQKMETVGTLAGGIAHDFNNVLTPIIWCSEMMLADMPPPEEVRDHLEHMLLAARRARELINQMLTFSRRSVRKTEPVHLAEVAEETIGLVRTGCPRNVRIAYEKRNGEDLVLADRAQMQQVVMNLCTNAFHAMHDTGGTVVVEIDAVDVDDEHARAVAGLTSGRFIRLVVRDQGRGMDPETAARVFEPFFTTKPVGEGTGLGLAVLHGIVTSHGGAVTVDSAPGDGACFTVYLPVHDARGLIDDKDPEHEPRLEGQGHILFVDDEPEVARVARLVLEKAGYRVTVACDSVAAAGLVQTHPARFDLVICDHLMPRLTGLQLATKVMMARADLPMILVTGAVSDLDRRALTELGVDAVLSKPVSREVLLEKVAEILHDRAVRDVAGYRHDS